MTLALLTCPKFLALLDRFYAGMPRRLPLEASLVAADDVPPPYRGLLVHRNDMTSTLQRHHGEKVALKVLERAVTDGCLERHIVLEGERTRRPLEYGAARIELGHLSEEARQQVLDCREPLGSILSTHRMVYECCPGGFFRIRSNELIGRVLQLDRPQWLFGRCNCLSDASGRTIAEVVEVLPPETQSNGNGDQVV